MSKTTCKGTETKFVFSNEFFNFTTVPNFIFMDKSLSFKAVGIYCSIVRWHNSPSHKISIRSLQQEHKDGKDSVQSGLNELIKAGFIEREQTRDKKGRIQGTIYTVLIKPKDRS